MGLLRGIPLLFLFLATSCFPCIAANPPAMRPYGGIGVVQLAGEMPDSHAAPLHLYREPGIYRIGELSRTAWPGNEWIFGKSKGSSLLIVMGRKGNWLRVVYDDAGREAWVELQRQEGFRSWEQFLKTQICRLLPGLRKQYYQLYRQPGRETIGQLSPKQSFKVLRVDGDWAMIIPDPNSIGWLRWQDEDGRLLVGLDH